jgi:hypothetical protein
MIVINHDRHETASKEPEVAFKARQKYSSLETEL